LLFLQRTPTPAQNSVRQVRPFVEYALAGSRNKLYLGLGSKAH
jgi:hypothetical protein